MHASAHLVVDISGAVLIDQLTQLLELPILYLNAHLIAATGIQHESKLLGGQDEGEPVVRLRLTSASPFLSSR